MISRSGEWGEVAVFCYNKICTCSDRAIGKNIIVWIMVDDLEVLLGSDTQQRATSEFYTIHQAGKFLPTLPPAKPGNDFLVFQKYPG